MIPRYLPLEVYKKRRESLSQKIRPVVDLILYFNTLEKARNHDSEYTFRPDSSFLYLTGFPEAQSSFMLWRESKGAPKFQMFTMNRDASMEQWTGKRYGPKGAEKVFGAHKAFLNDELEAQIREFLAARPKGISVRVLTNAFSEASLRDDLFALIDRCRGKLRQGLARIDSVEDIKPHVSRMRLVKDKHEIETLRKAASITVDGHLEALETLAPGRWEYEIQAAIEGEFQRQGALEPSYNSIVASGANATILHYGSNNRQMKAGELLLIDAGCEYQNYAGDITRTFPVSGTYSPEQMSIMKIVGEAHYESIRVAKNGVSYPKIHETATKVIVEGLKTLKILKGNTKDIIKSGKHRKYFPHGTGHWLGLDVHDECPYTENGKDVKLKPGMVFTVEPGIYFLPEDKSVPAKYRGIGVRIEDDILVKSRGPGEILTKGLPRYAEEIEIHMRNL